MTAFPRIHEDATCPLPGYEGYTFRVLANPTGAEKTDWFLGNLGIDGCAECAKLGPARGKQGKAATATVDPDGRLRYARVYCPSCQEARDRMGRAAVAIYGTSHVEGFDFSTPETAVFAFEQDMPDELLAWLYLMPTALWAARSEDLKKRLNGASTTGS